MARTELVVSEEEGVASEFGKIRTLSRRHISQPIYAVLTHKEPSFLANYRLMYRCAGLEEMNLAENCVSWRNKPVSHVKSRSLRSREKAKRTIFPEF